MNQKYSDTQINKEAIEWNKKNPPKNIPEGQIYDHSLFGYIAEIEDKSYIVELWNPEIFGSEQTRRFKKKTLEDLGISKMGQGLRVCIFKDKNSKKYSSSIESIGELETKVLPPINPGLDVSKFRISD